MVSFHLPVMALFGVRQVAVGLNTIPKHRHLTRGLLVRALSLLLSPVDKTFPRAEQRVRVAQPLRRACQPRIQAGSSGAREGEDSLGCRPGLISAAYPLPRWVFARCVGVSVLERGSRRGDKAIGVSVPAATYTYR